MCLSVLAYQEIGRRIEELTGAIYALDPYFVMSSDEAATLSMLVSSARHAQSARRARSPERRTLGAPGLAGLAGPTGPEGPAGRARSPWARGGSTYAEIVKGAGSRSSSRGEPRPGRSPTPVLLEPCVISDRVDEDPSDTRVCEIDPTNYDTSVSDSYTRDVNVYYDDYTERSDPEPTQEQYATPPVENQELPVLEPEKVYQEHTETMVQSLPERVMQELHTTEQERAPSPFKHRSHELSYAEILALGLRKQPRTQSVTSLPKPQVAHVELVKEIVVECVERSPTIQQYESKVERIEPPRFKPDRQERSERPERVDKLERPDRPPPRSRSREMPRQRRAPEKRPTKAHDVQAQKKKKTMKKVIEVQDFDEPEFQVELNPIRNSPEPVALVQKEEPNKEIKEVTKKLQHSATVVETVTEIVTEDSQPDTASEEVEHKKSKKKKMKKSKSSEDEIVKALKEIEELEKNKKKKIKEPRDKSKDSAAEVIAVETLKESHVGDTKKTQNKDETQIKSKKKKIHKDLVNKASAVSAEFITVESIGSQEETSKDIKPKKKKSQKQSSVERPTTEHSATENLLDVISVETSIIQESTVGSLQGDNVEIPSSDVSQGNEQQILEISKQPEYVDQEQHDTKSDIIENVSPLVSTKTTSDEKEMIESNILTTETETTTEETISHVMVDNFVQDDIKVVDVAMDEMPLHLSKEIINEPQILQEKANPPEETQHITSSFEETVKESANEIPKDDLGLQRPEQTTELDFLSVEKQETSKSITNIKESKNKMQVHKDQLTSVDVNTQFLVRESAEVEQICEEQSYKPSVLEKQDETSSSSKNKKKKKQKKQEKAPDHIICEASENVEIIEENVKLIEPVIEEVPTVVEQVEEQKPAKKKKSKKGRNTTDIKENVETLAIEQKDVSHIKELTENINQEQDVLTPQEELKRSKKKSKPKLVEGDDLNIKTISEVVDPVAPPEVIEEEFTFEEVKTHKKKKSKKQKIDDDDIDKALKEIERSEGSKKKSKDKVTKPKSKPEQSKSFVLDTGDLKSGDLKDNEDVVYDISPEEEIENVQPIEHIDWNAMLEEEEGVSDTTFEPINIPTVDFTVSESEHVASQITILQEASNLLLGKESSVVDKKERPAHSNKSSTSTNTKEEKFISREEKTQSATSPANEQNNNDKFFSPDALKEGSFNIVEEITHYEPMTRDVETRTIYLITHEEKKLPPIRTVKIRSKSNSLEEPQSIEQNVVLSEELINNKITDEKSSINISDNDLDTKIITDQFIRQEQLLDSISESSKNQTGNILVDSGLEVTKVSHESNETKDLKTTSNVTNLVSEAIAHTIEEKTSDLQKQSDVIELPTDEGYMQQEYKEEKMRESSASKIIEPEPKSSEQSAQPTSKPLTEEDFSDILEEAIFGSVQDRNRVLDKRTKDKFPNIPYLELVNEFKSYSVDLDTYQLDYDYTQLMISQRDKPSQQTHNTITDRDFQEILSSPPKEHVPYVNYQDLEAADIESAKKSPEPPTKISPAKEDTPNVNYQELKAAEILLATNITEQSQQDSKIVYKQEETQVKTVTGNDTPIVKPIDEMDASALILAPNAELEQNLSKEQETIISSLKSEEPRTSYHEIKDAEIILAAQISHKFAKCQIAELEKVSSKCVPELVQNIDTCKKSYEKSLKAGPSLGEIDTTNITAVVQKDDRAPSLTEEASKIIYHEIKDAELILASHSDLKGLSVLENKTSQIFEAPKSIDDGVNADVSIIASKEKPQNIENILFETLDTSITTTTESVTKQTFDFITTESTICETTSTYVQPSISSEESLRTPTNEQFNALQNETFRISYQEIADAEKEFGLATKPDNNIPKSVDKGLIVDINKKLLDLNPASILSELASKTPTPTYQDISDAEKLITKKVETSTVTVIDNQMKSESPVADKVTKPPSFIYEIPRQSYHEICDAEAMLAAILSKSPDTCLETSLSQEVVFKNNDARVLKEESIETQIAKDVNITTNTSVAFIEQKVSIQSEAPVSNGDLESPVIENVIEIVSESEPIRQPLQELPRFNYHELNDAERLFASTRRPPIVSEVTEATTETLIARTVEKDTDSEKHTEKAKASEPLHHNYHEIQDAEHMLATLKSRETTPEYNKALSEEQHIQKEATNLFDKIISQDEESVIETVTSQPDSTVESNLEQNVTFIPKETSIPSQKPPLEKIESSFEVDDLSNTPISVVYGDVGNMTPTVELASPEYNPKNKADVKLETNVDEILVVSTTSKAERLLTEEDTFEIIDHSEVADIPMDQNPNIIEAKKTLESDANTTTKSMSDDLKMTTVSVTDQVVSPRCLTPKTSDDHKIVEVLIEEALKEPEAPKIADANLSIETFEIDDINDSLVPVVFGNIKDIEQSIKNREFNIDEPGSTECQSPQIIDEIISTERAPSSIEDIEIVETADDFVIPQTSEILDVQLDNATNLALEPKPETISAEFITTEISKSLSNFPHSDATYIHPDIDTQKSTDNIPENLDLANVTDIELTETETVSRLEKSPIHSLHDLLPEIDSIPEFKPSYPNTVLYSKLSADAPEFTPSYMYQTITTVSESRTDLVEDAPLPLTVEEDSNITSEQTPTVQQISYSSILQTKKEKLESESPIPLSITKIPTESALAPEDIQEEHVEIKSRKSKKKKKKEKEEASVKAIEQVPPVAVESQPQTTASLSEPVNVWLKTAEDGKSYAEVVAEGLVHEQKEFIQLVNEMPKEKEPTQLAVAIDRPQEDEKLSVQPEPPMKILEKGVETVSEPLLDNSIGSWAKIVATKRYSPDRSSQPEDLNVESTHTQIRAHAPMILVDETDNDHHKPEIEIDAEGFITVDRSRRSRSRSRSRDTRSQSNVVEKRETREKSENRFEALTSSLKPDDIESTQSPSEDEKPLKKSGRKSRSSKSKEKEIKPKVTELAPSTSDEDKQPPKKDKKKRSSKSKDAVIKTEATDGNEILKEKVLQEPSILEDKFEAISTLITQPESKKKSKKKKKDKKPVDIPEATETSSPIEVTSSEQEIMLLPIPQPKKFDTPLSTPESIQTPVKDRVFSDAQYWKMDPGSLDLSEIISVEIQHAPTYSSTDIKTIKIDIKDDNRPTEEKLNEPSNIPEDGHKNQSASELIAQEFLTMNTQTQDLEAKIEEDQSLESKMADLQREIEEMLQPENDSSLMSDDSPKELTDTQTSIEFQYDELLDNMTPSLATPEPDGFEYKSLEEPITQSHEKVTELNKTQHEEDLDDKHISMSMIDSVLDDTEPISISMTETHSLEQTDLLITQEEDITPRETEKTGTITSSIEFITPCNVSPKENLSKKDLHSTSSIQQDINTSDKSKTPNQKNETESIAREVTSFIQSEQMQHLQKSMESEIINKKQIEATTDSFVTHLTSFIERERLQDKAIEESNSQTTNDKMLSKTDTVDTTALIKHETGNVNNTSNFSVSNFDITTNNLTNLQADTFWTDKHTVDDAEVRLIERKSIEKTILPISKDESHIDEGISVEENIINDSSFWPEKHMYHDAECQYFLLLASKIKTSTVEHAEIKIKDESDKDKDQGGSSGHSSEGEEPKEASGSPLDSSYISMDLPGGICSWRDKSSYLSAETPTVVDDVKELVSREDILTTLPVEPAPSSSIQEPEAAPQRTAKVTDPQSYCTIFKYIIYVWHDIITKFLISHITKLCIVMCLATPQLVL